MVLGLLIGIGIVVFIAGIGLVIVHMRQEPKKENSSITEHGSDGREQEGNEDEACDDVQLTLPNQHETRNYILDNINRIVERKPQSGSRWTAVKFEFIDATNVYIEYTDGATIERALLRISRSCLKLKHEILAIFQKEGETFRLDKGEDLFHDVPIEQRTIFEFYEPDQEWITKEERERREEQKRLEEEALLTPSPTEENLQD